MDTQAIITIIGSIGALLAGNELVKESIRRWIAMKEARMQAEITNAATSDSEAVAAKLELERLKDTILQELRMRVTTLEAGQERLNGEYIKALTDAARCHAELEAIRKLQETARSE